MPTHVCCLPAVCGRCLRLAARLGARRTDRETARLAARFLARENTPPIAPCPKYFERPLVLFLFALPPLLYSARLFQRPEPRRSAHAARISVLCRYHRRVRLIAKNIFLQPRGNILIELRNLRSPSAENNHVRIEQIDDPRQRARQPVFESIQRRKRSGSARAT